MISTKVQTLLLIASSLVEAIPNASLPGELSIPSSQRRLDVNVFTECIVLKSFVEYDDSKAEEARKSGEQEVCSCIIEDGNVADLTNLSEEVCSQMISSESMITSTAFYSDASTQRIIVPQGAMLETTTIKKEGSEYEEGYRNRRLGDKKVLIVRAVAPDSSTTSSELKLKEEILGVGGSDNVNLSSQYNDCSYGQLTFSASAVGNSGSYTVTIKEKVNGEKHGVIRNAMNSKWQNDLGDKNTHDLDYVLLCIPPGTSGGWIAYAYINYWLSVYNDRWCEYPSGLMHEIGHNLGLAHSGEGSNEYADQSGLMGYSYGQDEGPIMCFNGVKTWQLNWFPDYHQSFQSNNPFYWQGDLIGFVDRDEAEAGDKMIFKLTPSSGDEYYVHFNRQIRFNSGTREGGNQVLISKRQRGSGYATSFLQAILGGGGSYTISNFGNEGDLIINVGGITLNSVSKSSADLTIHYGTPTPSPTRPPTPSPTRPPTPQPPTPSPPSYSCISGETGILSVKKGETDESITKVRDLQIEDTVRGLDSNRDYSTSCKIKAIGSFGNGPVFGNYTADHFVYNERSRKIQVHGKTNGPMKVIDKWDLISDCPLVEDESGTKFGAMDSDFCGGQMKKLSWKNYLLLHQAILRVVLKSGTFWFSQSSYKDMETLRKFAPRVCKNMLKCMKNNNRCSGLEKASMKLVDKALTKAARTEALQAFTNLGVRCQMGSVSAVITAGKSVDESLVGTESC